VVSLWGRSWSRPQLLARVGRLEQVGGVQLTLSGAEQLDRIAGQAQQLAGLAPATSTAETR